MTCTLLHTADWHLGHTLHGHDRSAEHRAFLAWLATTIVEREVDVLLVAGDVFDARTPPSSAQAMLYGFLADARARRPSLEVVLLAGNHDSPSRLAAPRPLLAPLGVHVVAAATPNAPASALVVPLRRGNETLAALAAVPYLRPSDLAGVGDGLDPLRLAAASRALHASVAEAARAVSPVVVGAAHGEIRGAVLSPKSERVVAGGGSAALGAPDLVPGAIYVGLGHLHCPQWVGGTERARYAGSPFPLALDEAGYTHSVSLVSIDRAVARTEALGVPRPVGFRRFPAEGSAPLEVVLEGLAALPAAADLPPERWPFVELAVELDGPVHGLRAQCEAAIEGRAGRLCRIAVAGPRSTPRPTRVPLEALDVREMVVRKWESEHGAAPGPELLAALDEAIAAATARLADEEARRLGALSPGGGG